MRNIDAEKSDSLYDQRSHLDTIESKLMNTFDRYHGINEKRFKELKTENEHMREYIKENMARKDQLHGINQKFDLILATLRRIEMGKPTPQQSKSDTPLFFNNEDLLEQPEQLFSNKNDGSSMCKLGAGVFSIQDNSFILSRKSREEQILNPTIEGLFYNECYTYNLISIVLYENNNIF